jgi:hypothetical protein
VDVSDLCDPARWQVKSVRSPVVTLTFVDELSRGGGREEKAILHLNHVEPSRIAELLELRVPEEDRDVAGTGGA